MEVKYRLVLLGDAGVGKTALVLQLTLQKFDFEENHETIEDEYRKQLQINGQTFLITFLDTGGGEKFICLRDSWIGAGDAFVLVYSVSSRLSFTHIQSLHDHIRRVEASSTPSHSQLPSALRSAPAQIMIVANKTDQAREVSTEEGRALAEELGCLFAETCAKDCTSIETACSNFIRRIWLGMQDERAPGKRHDQKRTAICGVMMWCKTVYSHVVRAGGHRWAKLARKL